MRAQCRIAVNSSNCIVLKYFRRAHHLAQNAARLVAEASRSQAEFLRNWHTVAENSRFTDLADLKRSFGTADYVPPYTVFDVAGNKFRVVVLVRYRDGKMFVRWVMTHREYDDWCKLYSKGKV